MGLLPPRALPVWSAAMVLVASATALVVLAATAGGAWASDPLREQQWYLQEIRAAETHGLGGSGVTVAVLDSGVDAGHPDLAGQVTVGPDLVDGTGAGRDPNGHGTNVAGIIAARADNNLGIAGIAPGARVLSVRVLDAQGGGSTDVEAEGIDGAVAAGVQVINLSLGPSPDVLRALNPLDPIVPALQRAADAGVVVVAAAGNYALPLCAQPVLVSGMLCVGSVNRRLTRADYSDYGVRVDVVAGGGDGSADDGVISTAPGGGYAAMIGTSQAAPQAAALAALLVSVGLRGQAVIDRIIDTARDIGPRGDDFEYGHGIIDAQAALAGFAATPEPTASSRPPTPIAGTLRAPTVIRRDTLLRRGLRLRLHAAIAGRWRARLTVDKTAIARADRRLSAAGKHTITLKPTRQARRLLAHRRSATARLTVLSPDATKNARRLNIRG